MTEKLYRLDTYIKEFSADVLSCRQDGKKFEVILDRTAFFPEGGGQPGDRGYIGEAKVLDTVEKDGEITHICDREVSGKCECRLDWDFRFGNMQQHTGEHIFSGFIHRITGLDNVGFHMGENEVTVDFNGAITEEQLIEAEERANRAIYENIEIEEIYPCDSELSSYDYRSKKEIYGQVRLIKIEGADLCACCGTHTKRTGEVGIIKVVSFMNYKQGLRITLRIGHKALLDYREKNNSVAMISASLCAKTGEVADAVEKLKEKQKETAYRSVEIKRELFALKCAEVTEEFPVVFDGSGNADDARELAVILSDKTGTAYAFSGNDENGYKYAVVSVSEDVRETGKKINAALSGRGGGKPECVMGSVSAKKEEIIKFFKQ